MHAPRNPGTLPSEEANAGTLVNTPLQHAGRLINTRFSGVYWRRRDVNRSSDFQHHAMPFGELETAEAVAIPSLRRVTSLKRGVNERKRGVNERGRRIREMLGMSFALTVWLCLLAGCSSFRTEMGRPLSAETNNFAEARTRVDTVVHELGPPHQVSRLPDGFVFLYEYSRISEFQLGFSMNVPIVRWLKFLKAWNQLEHQSLVLTFDEQGVLRGEGSGNLQQSLGGGGGVQLLFAVMSFSDVSDFLRPAEAHGWGETLLQPLPVVLNSDESLRSGEHGLQQRIAPDYAGQHTLEMTQPKTEKEKKRIKKNYQMPPP